jgi:hypothetical protein
VGTQASNVRSLNLYLRSGFQIEQCRYVMHRMTCE